MSNQSVSAFDPVSDRLETSSRVPDGDWNFQKSSTGTFIIDGKN